MTNTIETKTIVSIPHDAAIVAALDACTKTGATLNQKLAAAASACAAQVADLVMPFASKLALIEATYTAEIKKLAAQNRNFAQMFRALLTAKVAGDGVAVEVAAPKTTKDGKHIPAVVVDAGDLSPSQAKTFAAEIKASMAEAEATPEEKAAAQEKAAEAAKEAKRLTSVNTAAAQVAQQEAAFAFVLSPGSRAELTKRLAAMGLKLTKAGGKREPIIDETPIEEQD